MKKIIIITFILVVCIINIFQSSVLAKVNHFKAFIASDCANTGQGAYYDNLNKQAILAATKAMQKLEYNNYYGYDNYHITGSKSDVLSYIKMTSNNYALAVLGHGLTNSFLMGTNQNIYTSDISGNWHLVLIISCNTFNTDAFARSFKTVGYSHRASIGFTREVTMLAAQKFCDAFNSIICSTTLNNVVNYARNASSAPAILYGDGAWNGYAWN